MQHSYRLTEDDLHTVFSRYGKIVSVTVGTVDASEANIEFIEYDDAQRCVKALNGKVLSGDKGTLCVHIEESPTAMGQQTGNFDSNFTSAPNQMNMQSGYVNNSDLNGMLPYNAIPGTMPNMFNNNYGFPSMDTMPPGSMDMLTPQPTAADYAAAAAQAQARAYAASAAAAHTAAALQTVVRNEQGHLEVVGANPPAKPNKRNRSKKKDDKSPSRVRKFTCRFDVGINNEKQFQVARRIIGSKGSNMKKIFKDTGAKLRLRGQGSGFLEGTSQQESPEALHLCVSAKKIEDYQKAVKKIEELLQGVFKEYRAHCKQKGLDCPTLRVVCREHPLVTMHRNAMKAKASSNSQNEEVEDTLVVVADRNQEGAACVGSPAVSENGENRADSVDDIHAMIAQASKSGSTREEALLKEIMRLRAGSQQNSATNSEIGDCFHDATEETA